MKNKRSKYNKSPSRAFTIVELLVAVGVTAVLVTLMVSITLNLLNGWNKSSGRLSANATARLILDQMEVDLSGVIMNRDSNVWLAATVQRDQSGTGDALVSRTGSLAQNAADWGSNAKPNAGAGSLQVNTDLPPEEWRFGKAGVWLRFITTIPDRGTSGDLQNFPAPRAVGYQIVRTRIGSATSQEFIYQIFRSEVRPYHTNAAPTGTGRPRSVFRIGYNLYTTDSNGYNATPTSGTIGDKDAWTIRNPLAMQLIGNNVVDFGVVAYERDSSGNKVEIFPRNRRDGLAAPTSAPFSLAVTASTTATLAGTGPQTYGFPTELLAFVRVLTPEGVRLIQALESGNATFADSWWEIVDKNSLVFTRRIALKGSARVTL